MATLDWKSSYVFALLQRQVRNYNQAYNLLGVCDALESAPAGPTANDVYYYIGAAPATVFGVSAVAPFSFLHYSGSAWAELIIPIAIKLEANMDANSKKITGLAAATSNGEAVRKDELDAGLLLKFDKTSVANDTYGRNLFLSTNITNGYYVNPITGAIEANALYKMSNAIPVSPSRLTISGLGNIHYGLGWRFNKADGSIALRGVCLQDVTEFEADGSALEDVVSFQFTVKTAKTDDNLDVDTIQVEVGDATTYEAYKTAPAKINGEHLAARFAFVNPTEDNHAIGLRHFNTFALKATDLTYIAGKNKFNKAGIIAGYYINGSTGELTEHASYTVSPVIPTTEGTTYRISGIGSDHYALGLVFRDENGTILSSLFAVAQNATASTLSITAPTGATELQFTVKTASPGDNTDVDNIQIEEGTTITEYAAYEQLVESIFGSKLSGTGAAVSSLATIGKNIIYFGDSITTQDGGTINWPVYADMLMGTNGSNYACSGASFTDWAYTTNIRQQLSAQIAAALSDEAPGDIVVVAMGTNDYARFSTFGSYDTAMGKAVGSLDKAVVIEAARWSFWKIREQWPDAVCFYANPLQRASVSVYETEANENGNWLRDEIERMARRYNFIVVDQYGKSGIVRDFEVDGSAGRYLADGLHTNTAGKELQGIFLSKQIINNY